MEENSYMHLNQPGKIIYSGVEGTALMTLLSYLVSEAQDENFKEPEYLAGFAEELLPGLQRNLSLPAGFFAHFSVGVGWAVLYELLFRKSQVRPLLWSVLKLGAVSGIAGVMVWKMAFKLSRRPHAINYKRYFMHLLIAHVVFSLPVVKRLNKKTN